MSEVSSPLPTIRKKVQLDLLGTVSQICKHIRETALEVKARNACGWTDPMPTELYNSFCKLLIFHETLNNESIRAEFDNEMICLFEFMQILNLENTVVGRGNMYLAYEKLHMSYLGRLSKKQN